MPVSTRVFIDYWNFQLSWNSRSNANCDWSKLPASLAAAAQACAPQPNGLQIDDVRVYASCEHARDAKLRRWLDSFLDRQPGFRVFTRERHPKHKAIHCRACGHELAECPNCNGKYVRATEKGVDSAIITDMFSMAWEKACEVMILVSGDADLVPAVEKIQDKGFKVMNATWKGYGHHLAKACWASFDMDPLMPALARHSTSLSQMSAQPGKP